MRDRIPESLVVGFENPLHHNIIETESDFDKTNILIVFLMLVGLACWYMIASGYWL